MSEKGIKYDGDKAEMYLLPPLATLEVGKVLTYGAKKYSPDNWRKVPGLQQRYTSAALRHLLADMSGEATDEETELSHLAHAICCLLFKLEDRLMGQESVNGRDLYEEIADGFEELREATEKNNRNNSYREYEMCDTPDNVWYKARKVKW